MSDIRPEDKTIPFFPDHVKTEAWVALGIMVIVFAIGIIGVSSHVGLEPMADPMDTPAHIKPEWYFLFLFQLLKYIPKALGSTLPFIGIGVLLLWPFFDRKPDTRRARWIRVIGVTVTMLAIIILSVMAAIA